MRIRDYLEAKYKVLKPTTMMYCEAKAFGIPYPLESGWLERYGSVEITSDVAETLKQALQRKGTPSALDGIKVLDRAWITLMRTPKASSLDFLQSKAWKRVRLQALIKYGSSCQCCGLTASDGAVLNVDHIKPRLLFPELALNIDNLQVLCSDCNEGKGNWCMNDFRD